MRYVILITPASVILFSLLMDEAIRRLKLGGMSSVRKNTSYIIVIISTVVFLMEIVAGIKSSLFYNYDLIIPLIGGY